MRKKDFLGEAIARELRRKASVSDRTLKRFAPRVRDLPEPQVAPSQPAWCFNNEVVKLMRALGYEWHAPQPEPPDKEPKRKRDPKRASVDGNDGTRGDGYIWE